MHRYGFYIVEVEIVAVVLSVALFNNRWLCCIVCVNIMNSFYSNKWYVTLKELPPHHNGG